METLKDITAEEMIVLCNAIGLKRLKRFYKEHSKQFAKIYPGVKANTLSDEKIIALTFQNRNQPFIADFLDKFARDMISTDAQKEFVRLMNVESKIKNAEVRLSSLQKDCDNRARVIEEYQIKFEELIKSIKRSNQVYDDLKNKIDKKSTAFSRLLYNYDYWKAQTQICKDKFSELDSLIKQSKRINSDLKVKNTFANDQLCTLQRDCEELEAQLKHSQDKFDELTVDIESKEKILAELDRKITIAESKHYRPGRTVESVVDDDYVYAFEDELGIESGTIEKFALYMRAAFDNKTPLLLAGPKGREIADAFSTALTGKTAAVFDCAAVKILDDLKVIEVVDDPIVAIINPLAPNFIAYIPEIVGIKNKFIVALHPFAEDLKLEPRGLYNYFLPVFTELLIDAPTLLRKTIKTLKSNVDGSTELFAEFPFEYVNGRGEKFLKGFKGDGAALDKMRAFMGGDDE